MRIEWWSSRRNSGAYPYPPAREAAPTPSDMLVEQASKPMAQGLAERAGAEEDFQAYMTELRAAQLFTPSPRRARPGCG